MNQENCKHVPNAEKLKVEEIIKNKDYYYLQYQKDRFGERWKIINKTFEKC